MPFPNLSDLIDDDALTDLIDRAKKLRGLKLDDLPMADLMRWLEQKWQPDTTNLLGSGSITSDMMAPGAVILDTQTKNGVGETYSGNFTTAFIPLADNTGGGAGNMQLTYTPDRDCWWEVSGYVGIVSKVDAAYHYLYGQIALSPADVDSVSAADLLVTQHNSVNQYEGRALSRIFKLASGTAYTASLGLVGMNGGTWQYYCGPAQLWLNGKAWAR